MLKKIVVSPFILIKNNVSFFSAIKPPPNPTMAESFGSKVKKEDLEKFMNPTGFLSEKDFEEYEGIDKKGIVKTDNVKEDNKSNEKFKEYGFKVKGPEPTRFGDWERKGRVSDF